MTIDPLDSRFRPFIRRLEKKRASAFIVLACEHIALHSWRIFFWTLLFCGLWMLNIPVFFGQVMGALTTILFIFGLVYLIRRDLLRLTLPKGKDVDRRLEKNSALAVGQIALIEDNLANPDKDQTRTLWNKAQRKGLFSLKHLKTPRIRPFLSKEDPRALRYITILIFISGLFVAGGSWQERIAHGLMPITPSYALSHGKSTNLWIKPPDYTQLPQAHLSGHGTYDQTLDIPESSSIRIRLHSVLGEYIPPRLHMGGKTYAMTYMQDGLYGIETTIEPGTSIRITQGMLPRARWDYSYIIDTPPEIYSDTDSASNSANSEDTNELPRSNPPFEFLDNGQIRFPLIVKDDYGVKEIRMVMRLDEMVEDKPLGEEVEEFRLVMSQPGNEFKIAPKYDMSWHTWAGLPVTFEYEAIDHKGQSTKLDKISLVLPLRTFEHPMAKSLIAMRKKIAWEFNASFIEIATNIETLLNLPDFFQNDLAIFLSIRSAASRLYHNNNKPREQRITSAKEVINLLWYITLAIEEGDISLAMRELRDAQRALENAMRDPDTTDQEIRSLMDNLRQKMANYFAEAQREMQKRMAEGEDIPPISPDDFTQFISPDTIGKMMSEIEQALREGDEQKAAELMSQLQRMMEMMDPSKNTQLPRDMQAMREGVNELKELIDRQEDLLGQTGEQAQTQRHQHRKNRARIRNQNRISPRNLPALENMLKDFGMNGEMPPPPPVETKDKPTKKSGVDTSRNKVEQEALRYILGQLMLKAAEHIDEVPEKMGMAEQEMRGSSKYLGKNSPILSVPHQEKAIKYLKEAQEDLSKQFRQRMKQMIGIGMGGQAQQYDPLGRRYYEDNPDGESTESKVKVPDEAQKKRVDGIIKQLRDRSGDRSRPREELNYFRRLLRQF